MKNLMEKLVRWKAQNHPEIEPPNYRQKCFIPRTLFFNERPPTARSPSNRVEWKRLNTYLVLVNRCQIAMEELGARIVFLSSQFVFASVYLSTFWFWESFAVFLAVCIALLAKWSSAFVSNWPKWVAYITMKHSSRWQLVSVSNVSWKNTGKSWFKNRTKIHKNYTTVVARTYSSETTIRLGR